MAFGYLPVQCYSKLRRRALELLRVLLPRTSGSSGLSPRFSAKNVTRCGLALISVKVINSKTLRGPLANHRTAHICGYDTWQLFSTQRIQSLNPTTTSLPSKSALKVRREVFYRQDPSHNQAGIDSIQCVGRRHVNIRKRHASIDMIDPLGTRTMRNPH